MIWVLYFTLSPVINVSASILCFREIIPHITNWRCPCGGRASQKLGTTILGPREKRSWLHAWLVTCGAAAAGRRGRNSSALGGCARSAHRSLCQVMFVAFQILFFPCIAELISVSLLRKSPTTMSTVTSAPRAETRFRMQEELTQNGPGRSGGKGRCPLGTRSDQSRACDTSFQVVS